MHSHRRAAIAIASLGMLPLSQARIPALPDAAASEPAPAASAAAAIPMADGVVESVEAANGLVTLRHGDIVSIQMPAMTMTFGVVDKKMLSSVKAGDRVRFRVEVVANVPTITRIEPAP